jgi:hypothetical protein
VRVLPKLAFGEHVTDYVIRRASGDYLMVGLESPKSPLFTKTGHNRAAELTQAIGQIVA